MSVKIVKHINEDENNRVKYLFVNFDYYDGNDIIAKLLCQQYGMVSDDKIDGMFYSVIKLHKNFTEYDLIWHVDVGNYIFSVNQEESSLLELEKRLDLIVKKLNEMYV